MDFNAGKASAIKPFTKPIKRKSFDNSGEGVNKRTSTETTGTNDEDDDDNDNDNGDGVDNIIELKESPAVSLTTILRWKAKQKVNVDCFLGFSDSSSEADKVAGTEILSKYGHFYCEWCQTYIRANKKSATRHQTRNKKHLGKAVELGVSDGIVYDSHPKVVVTDTNTSSNFIITKPVGTFIFVYFIFTSIELIFLFITKTIYRMLSVEVMTPIMEAWGILNNKNKINDQKQLNEILSQLGMKINYILLILFFLSYLQSVFC